MFYVQSLYILSKIKIKIKSKSIIIIYTFRAQARAKFEFEPENKRVRRKKKKEKKIFRFLISYTRQFLLLLLFIINYGKKKQTQFFNMREKEKYVEFRGVGVRSIL